MSAIPRKSEPATVLIGVGFKTKGRHLVIYADSRKGRHLVIYADSRKAGRFVAGAVRTNDDGAIEGFTLKVWAFFYGWDQ